MANAAWREARTSARATTGMRLRLALAQTPVQTRWRWRARCWLAHILTADPTLCQTLPSATPAFVSGAGW